MAKNGKRYAAARLAVPVGAKFAPDEAVQLVKQLAFAKFDETVEVATRLGVDPRKADQLVRGTVVLPHGTGKTVRVLVIAQGEKEAEAKEAGADYVGVDLSRRSRKAGSTSTCWSSRRTSWARSDRWAGCSVRVV
jgi:large subunit ribosomal protein L1